MTMMLVVMNLIPEISDDHDRGTCTCHLSPAPVIAVFLHPKALPDMFIFARKDPAVLVVCNVYPIGKKNTSRPFTPFLLSIFYLYQILFDYRSERRR